MNIITRGTNSTVIFTLEEKRTLASPYYLCKMTSRSGQNTKRFILTPDLTSAVERYNQFTITETSGTEVLTSGTVTLSPVGFWDYSIYEQTSSTNLSETASGNPLPLETGLILVKGTETTDNYFSPTQENKFYGQ